MADPKPKNDVLEHIDALRAMLLKMIATYVVFCIPGWFLATPLLNYLLSHAVPGGFTIHYFTLLEPFFVMIKLALTLAAMMSLPFTLFYVWQFVAPALLENEKRFICPLVSTSFLLACAGAASSVKQKSLMSPIRSVAAVRFVSLTAQARYSAPSLARIS